MTFLLAVVFSISAVFLWSDLGVSARRIATFRGGEPAAERSLSRLFDDNLLAGRVRRRRDQETWRLGVIELCDALGAELTAGRAPEDALAHAIESLSPALAVWLRPAVAASDVPAVLHSLSERPGAEGLRLLAACWRIGVERGATFAPVIDGLANGLRDDHDHHQQIRVQLAGTHATARLLAVLPLLGLAMAWSLGAHPLAFLFTTLPGLACLLAAIFLDVAGICWTKRIAAKAERP